MRPLIVTDLCKAAALMAMAKDPHKPVAIERNKAGHITVAFARTVRVRLDEEGFEDLVVKVEKYVSLRRRLLELDAKPGKLPQLETLLRAAA